MKQAAKSKKQGFSCSLLLASCFLNRLALTTAVALFSFAAAQFSYRGELETSANPYLISAAQQRSSGVSFGLRLHLEADYGVGPADLRLVVDPAFQLPDSGADTALVQVGLTEAYALYHLDTVDVSAGVERLPLETARLSVPFRLEPLGELGQPLGLVSARASVFLGDWRLRPAAVYRYQDEQAGAVLSVRREFSSFDLEAHALYLDGFAVGLGGSGLLGELVLYGEVWLLSGPWDGRTALGLSGFWDNALWTVEAAYGPGLAVSGGPIPSNAYPQLLGQFSLPLGTSGSLELNAGFGLPEALLTEGRTWQLVVSSLYNHTEPDYQLSVGPTLTHGELATAYGLRLAVTTFF